MRVVFGIDVSKVSSEVAILVNGEKVHGYTISNDAIGFSQLLGDLKTVHKPEIIFEATGVYSRRLQAFLDEHGYAYTRLNPLEAKKQLDSLRVRKTDQIDAEKLAQSQFVLNRKTTYVQKEVYQNLRDLSRFYQNLTEDIVRAKNRLHKVLQVTFPELENILSTPSGEQYWNLVIAFPCKDFVLDLSKDELSESIRQSTSKRISDKRVAYLAEKLIALRGNPYARKILFKCIHNITSASHTNPCHIADFYEKRKRQSQTTSTKPHTIASIHRLIRTMYYLIMHNKLYDYASTQNR